MNLIVAVDNQWGIGKNNDLLFHLPKDMKFFRTTTMDKIVAMGRKTLTSFPNSKPLKNRINVVLSAKGEDRDDCIVIRSLEEMKKHLAQYPTEDVFIIGGATFYASMLDYCETAYVTKIKACGDAQLFFPNLDEKKEWSLVKQSDSVQDGDYEIVFCVYKNSNPKSLTL